MQTKPKAKPKPAPKKAANKTAPVSHRRNNDVNVNLTLNFDEAFNKLVQIFFELFEPKFDSINTKLNKLMANDKEFKAALEKINEGTSKAAVAVTAVGDKITRLEDLVKNSGLTAEQEAAFLAELGGATTGVHKLAEALEAMGKDPANPVPIDPAPTDPVQPDVPVVDNP